MPPTLQSETFRPMTGDVSIRLANVQDARQWDEYVKAHTNGTAFHLSCWPRIVQKVHGHANYSLLAIENEQILGVLPLSHNKTKLFGNCLSSTPFCPYGGPLADNKTIQEQLLQEASRISEKLGANSLELRQLHGTAYSGPTQSLYVTFRKSLLADHEANMLAIPRKQRAMVRKGIQNGLTAELGSVSDFYDLYADNIHRHGTPGSPLAFFDEIVQAFKGDAEVLIVKSPAGLKLSGVLTLYFKDEVLPFYAGDVPEARNFAANDFKYWEVMQRAVNRGARVFDFGRSKKGTGPFAFKKNWGFEPTQLHYVHLGLKSGSIPEHNPLNPKFQLMINTWRRLPRPIVNFLGPLVVKGLG